MAGPRAESSLVWVALSGRAERRCTVTTASDGSSRGKRCAPRRTQEGPKHIACVLERASQGVLRMTCKDLARNKALFRPRGTLLCAGVPAFLLPFSVSRPQLVVPPARHRRARTFPQLARISPPWRRRKRDGLCFNEAQTRNKKCESLCVPHTSRGSSL